MKKTIRKSANMKTTTLFKRLAKTAFGMKTYSNIQHFIMSATKTNRDTEALDESAKSPQSQKKLKLAPIYLIKVEIR